MKILLSILLSSMIIAADFYDFTVADSSGSEIYFNSFRGKKVLLVNIATGSEYVQQLSELQQLQQQYADSVVVIAFPSNSFENEHRADMDIKSFCADSFGVTFPIAKTGVVAGPGLQPVYLWLTQADQNGSSNSTVHGDFQKYLVDSHGELLGIFSRVVSPLDPQITNTIMGVQP